MIDFNNGIMFRTLQEQAKQSILSEEKELQGIIDRLNSRIGGKSKEQISGGFVGSCTWLIVYIVLFIICQVFRNRLSDLSILMLLASGSLAICMIVSSRLEYKYYNTIINGRQEVERQLHNLSLLSSALPEMEQEFRSASYTGFDYPLLGTDSEAIVDSTRSLESRLISLAKANGETLNSAKNILYYASIIAITVCFGGVWEELMMQNVMREFILKGSFDYNSTYPYYYLIVCACTALLIFGARRFWAKTNCSVTNITLLLTILGPILIPAVCYALLLGFLVIMIALTIVAIIAGVGFIGGMLGG